MDQEQELIRRQIEEARASLKQKLELLEGQARDAVKRARAGVDKVHHAVDAVQRTFDVKRQVADHPWAAVGVAMLAGAALGFLRPGRKRATLESAVVQANGEPAAPPPSPGRWETLLQPFQEEIGELKELAIGAAAGVVRDLVKQSLPPGLGVEVEEIFNNATVKLGGRPIAGPVLPVPDKSNLPAKEAKSDV